MSCIALSRSGRYLASGQVTHMGFSAPILVWDLETGRVLHKMSLHKVKVQALSFSCDDRFLASLGGADDNSLVLWDVESGESICGSPTHNDFTQHVKCFNRNAMMLVTAGNYNLQVRAGRNLLFHFTRNCRRAFFLSIYVFLSLLSMF